MTSSRSLVHLALVASLAGCASAPARRAPVSNEITFDLSTSPPRTHEQLAAAFAANGLPVATSQPGVLEFHAPRERGVLGYYEVFARAVITPLDCGTRVTMFGEETHYPSASSNEGTATRIGPSSTGRARDVWSRLQSVATALHADSAVITRMNR
jgi:hypothetical protein